MKIIVSIDHLVLDGVSQHDLPRLQAAFEQALAQALTRRTLAARGSDTTHAAAAPIDVSRGPEAVGQAIARAAHARITEAGVGSRAAVSPRPAAAPPSPPLGAEAGP